MKKIFIVLSIVILAACSNNDIGGYTDSIVKDVNKTSLKSTQPQKISYLMKSTTSLEEDLSSLSEEALREKLIHAEPKPKAEPELGPYELNQDFFEEEILDYNWSDINPTFYKSEVHKYGFDSDPTGKDPIIYISVETGTESKTKSIAYFNAHLSTKAYDDYRLIHEESGTEIALTPDKDETVKDVKIEKEGKYRLEGCVIGLCSTVFSYWKKIKDDKSKNKEIILKTYPPIEKQIIYAQMDGDGWTTNETTCEEGFNQKCVTTVFDDEVYNQAVLKSKIIPYNDGIDYLIEVNMTDFNDEEIKKLKEKALNYLQDKDPDYWHFVFTINKEKKIWNLKPCQDDLKDCNGFLPENESSSTNYYMNGNFSGTCKDKKGGTLGKIKKPTQVDIKVTFTKDKDGTTASKHYHAYYKGTNNKVTYNKCDVLYTDDAYPVVPSFDGVFSGTAAANYPIARNKKNGNKLEIISSEYDNSDYDLFDNYLPYGSIIIAPRQAGKSSLYVLMHELGHSFGLTDVTLDNIYFVGKDYVYSDDPKILFSNFKLYASSETNLMSWQSPDGIKLRYRNTPIACTGGFRFYKDGKLIGATERKIEKLKDKKTQALGEHQWECVRGECFNTKATSLFSTEDRTDFFGLQGLCDAESGINSISSTTLFTSSCIDYYSKKITGYDFTDEYGTNFTNEKINYTGYKILSEKTGKAIKDITDDDIKKLSTKEIDELNDQIKKEIINEISVNICNI